MSRLDAVARAFDPERLTLARQLNRLTKTELASAIDVTSSALSQYERGTSRPASPTLAKARTQARRAARVLHEGISATGCGEPTSKFAIVDQSRTRSGRAEAFLLWDTLRVFEQHVRLPAVDMPHSPLGESRHGSTSREQR